MRTGTFIVLEGLDGSGTTTQAAALSDALRARGHVVVETREPTATATGRLLRTWLAGPTPSPTAMALLFATDRALHVDEVIQPALDRGDVVVCDRYLLSSWVYQALDCPSDWVRALNRHAPWPTLTAVLTVPSTTAMQRMESRSSPREVFETSTIQARVEAGYATVLDERLAGVVAIDGSRPPEVVTQELLGQCIAIGL